MISSTEMPPLKFSVSAFKQPYRSPVAKIGWMHTSTEKPGCSFDITIRDAMGRTMAERKNCKTDSTTYGELINLPTLVGENLEIEVSNLKGTEELTVFLN